MTKKIIAYLAIVFTVISFTGYAGYAVSKNLNGKSIDMTFPSLSAVFRRADLSGFDGKAITGRTGESKKSGEASTFAEFGSSAQSAVLIEANTGQTLYMKNPHARIPMASTAKIVTAITVINSVKELDATIKVPKEAAGVEGSSIYLREGESISYNDLLYGLMLQSGNDAATALAYAVGGDIDGFSKLMNKQAKEYGAVNSNFSNPHGLSVKDNYTTSYDMALITAQAMKNPVFKKIVSTKYVEISNEGVAYKRRIPNKNKLLSLLECADGVKTGYTRNAGRCFVGSASKNGMQLVCVVLNCGPMFEEAKRMLETAISQYSLSQVVYKHMVLGQVRVANRENRFAAAVSKEAFSRLADKHEEGGYEIRRSLTEINAPVKKGTEVGKYEIYFKNQLLFSEKLYIIEDID